MPTAMQCVYLECAVMINAMIEDLVPDDYNYLDYQMEQLVLALHLLLTPLVNLSSPTCTRM